MEIIINGFIIIIGLIIGSFLNVCIYRIPENQSIVSPPSHCNKCNNTLRIIDLIPVISYLMLRGKCRYCKEKVSVRYMAVELLTGILFLLVYNHHNNNIETIYYLILVSILVIISFIDIDHYIIPDTLIIFGIIVAISFNVLTGFMSFKDVFLGGLICGGSILFFIYVLEFIIKKEVMGGGDIKLFAMIGMFLGIKGGFITIILSIYLGAIYGIWTIVYTKIKSIKYDSVIPYGPFISLGAIIYILYGQSIIGIYKDFFTDLL